MSYLQAMERPTTLDQDEFKIEVRSCSENGIMCSSEGTSNFSFCTADDSCAYADEIFHNWKIQPLHSQSFQTITLYAHFPQVETINVHEVLEPCTSSAPHHHTSPSHYHSSSEPARATLHHHHTFPSNYDSSSEPARATLHHHQDDSSPTHSPCTHASPNSSFDVLARATPHQHASLTHAHHHHPHHTSPTHSHCNFDPARAIIHPHHFASNAPSPSFESSRAILHRSVAAICRRALCLFPLRRVCHVNEDESTCPPSREPFTPIKPKDNKQCKAKSTTHLCNMKKLHDVGNKLLVCKGLPQQGRKPQLKEAPLNIPPRIVHTPPSPHEIHYHAQRAQKEGMKNRTSLPYRHGLLACIC